MQAMLDFLAVHLWHTLVLAKHSKDIKYTYVGFVVSKK